MVSLFASKKSEAVTIAIILIIALVIILIIGVDIWSHECNRNSDCNSGEYCGSDFACHQIPTIEKTVVQNNFVFPLSQKYANQERIAVPKIIG